jgi:hypothetical protein
MLPCFYFRMAFSDLFGRTILHLPFQLLRMLASFGSLAHLYSPPFSVYFQAAKNPFCILRGPLSPSGMCFQRNTGAYRTFPPGRSRWSLSVGGFSLDGKPREPSPSPLLHTVYTVKDRCEFLLPPRSRICRRNPGSDIHKWAYFTSSWLNFFLPPFWSCKKRCDCEYCIELSLFP